MSERYTGTLINDLVETAEKTVRRVRPDRLLSNGMTLSGPTDELNFNNYVKVESGDICCRTSFMIQLLWL